MAPGGGSPAHPNRLVVNEIAAFYDDPGGPIVETKTIVYGWDAHGNQISRTVLSGVEVESEEHFGYDHENRLSAYVRMNGEGEVEASFAYLLWPLGADRLAKVDVLEQKAEWYVMDGRDVVADYEREGEGEWEIAGGYLQMLGVDSKWVKFDGAGEARYYLPDGMGSVMRVLDAAGEVVETRLTTAWGEPLVGAGADRYGFTQRERDAESGLMHYRARMYDPRIGRMLQVDPFGKARGFSPYAYVWGTPARKQAFQDMWEGIKGGVTQWIESWESPEQVPENIGAVLFFVESGLFTGGVVGGLRSTELVVQRTATLTGTTTWQAARQMGVRGLGSVWVRSTALEFVAPMGGTPTIPVLGRLTRAMERRITIIGATDTPGAEVLGRVVGRAYGVRLLGRGSAKGADFVVVGGNPLLEGWQLEAYNPTTPSLRNLAQRILVKAGDQLRGGERGVILVGLPRTLSGAELETLRENLFGHLPSYASAEGKKVLLVQPENRGIVLLPLRRE
jgi:RHS repeat-associated protein